MLKTSFSSSVGGLRPQINEIVRRVLDGRVIRPFNKEDGDDESERGDVDFVVGEKARLEADELLALGLSPVRGLLLYGPPGCGKVSKN
jgi:SpoVK/Ycf46/Vps4 family AAA+-type ATPase